MEDIDAMVAFAKHGFGWYGGTGDPPSDDDVRALVFGVLEYQSAIRTGKDNE